ncbi:alpha/beta hydrolase [Aquihabitans sp. G128]|uniref:alpha/beta hydrolase n=1 Tax=Aquihabitans sp. G128 TaxID=2849779 RepID=UPI001C24A558|nr:alpha/beta hydrolase [Aquihabitans sp. G128]QXC60929.1 alpha/beta hydrolase [Aquihabitans sp. G128]
MTATDPDPTDTGSSDRPPVDPAFAPLLALLADPSVAPMSTLTPDEAREAFRNLRGVEGEPLPVRSATDRTVPGPAGDVPVRIVVPEVAELTGVLVWFHGGGWVIGDLDTAEATQRRLAVAAGCVVVSVDYRLAPEHPAPAGFDDCWAATTWAAEHLDELGLAPGAPVAVGGDSAGGNLAALVALRAGEVGPPLALQLLVYPTTDLTLASPSVEENGEGYFLTAETMRWFVACNLAGGLAADDPSVSPLFADDAALARAAPAHVQVAGYDPLRDEGRAYHQRLADAGVATVLVEHPTMIHGFWAMATLTEVSDQAIADAAAALRAGFGVGV